MGAVQFIARRPLRERRMPNELVTFAVDLQDAIRSRSASKHTLRASDGAVETLNISATTQWEFTFEPVAGERDALMREFLANTAGRERFRIWVYGTEASPLVCRRIDGGYSPTKAAETARRDREPYVYSITAIEASGWP